jgi:hypothetical protein
LRVSITIHSAILAITASSSPAAMPNDTIGFLSMISKELIMKILSKNRASF